MVFKTPVKISVPIPHRTRSDSDLPSSSNTNSVQEITGKVQHSPKQQQFFRHEHCEMQNNINSDLGQYSESASSELDEAKLVQTGMDRYITVLPKRKRSPRSAAAVSATKYTKLASIELTQGNRFSSLIEMEDPVRQGTPQNSAKAEKPPPIYLREESSKNLIEMIKRTTQGKFYVSGVKRGNIKETKIQPLTNEAYRALVNKLELEKKHFYTYQLKSQKGLIVVIKGIESFVDVNEIRDALSSEGFNVKNITNIFNKDKVPQPMFRIELEPEVNTKGNHSIYKLRYLLHRKIVIEEPKKRTGPVQCMKCQEYGHTKAYCTLNNVCVICGELHNSKECDKSKTDASAKKCSNCNENHTANYRGCPVYLELKRRLKPKQRAEQRLLKKYEYLNTEVRQEKLHNFTTGIQVNPEVSYADMLKGTAPKPAQVNGDENASASLNKLTDMMQSFMTMMERTMDLLMQNMNMLMQVVAKNQK